MVKPKVFEPTFNSVECNEDQSLHRYIAKITLSKINCTLKIKSGHDIRIVTRKHSTVSPLKKGLPKMWNIKTHYGG